MSEKSVARPPFQWLQIVGEWNLVFDPDASNGRGPSPPRTNHRATEIVPNKLGETTWL